MDESREIKRIALFGSTGSIGVNSLEVIRRNPEKFSVAYLTANSRSDLLVEQIRAFAPRAVAILDRAAARSVRQQAGGRTEVLEGEEGLMEIAGRDDFDIMISALVGFAGLRPTIRIIENGKRIALANKETLVAAGEIIMPLLARHGAELLPIDSEHSAILQCLAGEREAEAEKIILTASGGPFRNRTREELHGATVREALNHPNWRMGNKITIDSATLMNKGLEVIEARWLFGMPAESIDVLIHPQSIIHSMVQFADGSIKAQMGVPDMKIPIQYALTWPAHAPSAFERIDFARHSALTFAQPDLELFECLALAYDALRAGGTMPAALNAANEVAVEAFLREEIPFGDIPSVVHACMERHDALPAPDLETVIETDREVRRAARSAVTSRRRSFVTQNHE